MELLIRGLATFLEEIDVFLLLIPPIILMISSHFIGLVEKKWVHLYEYADPLSSIVMFAVGLAILITYILPMIVPIIVPLSQSLIGLLLIVSFILAFVFTTLYAKKVIAEPKRT